MASAIGASTPNVSQPKQTLTWFCPIFPAYLPSNTPWRLECDTIRASCLDPAFLPTCRGRRMRPIVQISLDLTNIDEALETAELAMRAGVDWLEAGTPLILAEGLHGVRELRAAFPQTPIVADLKTMDGGYLEAEMMANAGATHVVVMARAHEETIRCVVKAGADFGCQVMGDNMVSEDMVAGAKRLEDLGCDYVIHHIGYDERRGIAARGDRMPSPLDQLREVVQAVEVPVQAVGGLSIEQAIECPKYGAPLVVLGAPLTIDADAFRTADGDLESSLRMICEAVHAQEVA
ncbi:orotidine 5'-phosphate decarboxylase / HUMPS family protein [Rhodopirellula bahusiensis]|nr:orotidine 5'-phosphate decarboxylase / HUMPS family protein [Rhodopirellula bahusiensis]